MSSNESTSADDINPQSPANSSPSDGGSTELTDEEARQRLGVSSGGLDRKKTIIGAIVAIVFLAIVHAHNRDWIPIFVY